MTLVSIILWLIFGAFVGWVASQVMGTDGSQNTTGDVVLGIAGSVVGGLVSNAIGIKGVDGISIYSFIISLIGAVIIITVGRIFMK